MKQFLLIGILLISGVFFVRPQMEDSACRIGGGRLLRGAARVTGRIFGVQRRAARRAYGSCG